MFNLLAIIEAQKESGFGIRNWNIGISTGFSTSSLCSSMENKLMHYGVGLDWDSSVRNYLPFSVEIDRTIFKKLILSVDLNFQKQKLISDLIGYDIFQFNTMSAGMIVLFNFRNIIFAGAGPVISQIHWFEPTNSSMFEDSKFLRGGLSVVSRITLPSASRFHFTFETKYTFNGSINPEYLVTEPGIFQYETTTVPVKSLKVNYLYLVAGIGFRF